MTKLKVKYGRDPNYKPQNPIFQLIAGGCSSMVDVMLMQPLDVITTRLQLQNDTIMGPDHYAGMSDAIKKIYRKEGMTAFWRGLVPVLVIDTPKRSIKFLVFDQSQQLFMFGAPWPSPPTYAFAGGLGGIVEALIQNPFEIIKITQQASRQKLPSIQVAKKIIENQGYGLHGLYRGMPTMVARNVVFNVIYFGSYWSVRDATPTCQRFEFLRNFTIACAASLLSCVASLPLDIVKTRIQGPQPVPGKVKYSGTLNTVLQICREEGWKALYKGLLPVTIRMVPGGAILLVGYEYIIKLLVSKYNK
ncbi:mitochondrial 2-oxodicarboxylate carrier isoform X1 [Drosophila mojavensis]|uniref:Mitochondrial 2-oxodicarboxylate carrier n=1 Tax=Drosophila mojavensis TaxID=7230 RepID=B4KFC3_DROMO|nr:mitochondrial 2-oxodicarboxylate carrier isoform X1 [Drosophila mojavensis]EDW12023.2 uncharacterized protein Dmoj_GI11957 [Drosophila mojavensis]